MSYKPWFTIKKYCLGWGLPSTWEGWVLLTEYFICISYMTLKIYSDPGPQEGTPYIIGVTTATVALIAISWMTSDHPKRYRK